LQQLLDEECHERMITFDERSRIEEEVAMDYFKAFAWRDGGKRCKTSVRIFGVPIEI
jgi:hypothetical protein